MGWGGSSSTYSASPTPSVVPGTSNVSTGATSSSNSVQAMYAQQLKKRRGYSSTLKNSQTSADQMGSFGKSLLGE